MFGIDDLALAAMVASAAMQQYGASQAAQKQQQAAREAQQRQLAMQNQATDVAMKQVQEFDPAVRKQRQDDITNQLTDQYTQAATAPQITAQGVQVGQTIPGGSSDYLVTKGREQAKATESLRNLAQLMGRTGSASELRRGEAVGIGDAAGQIGRIGTGANNMAGIDEVGIQAAGQPSLGAGLASAALGAYGMNGMMTSGLKKPAFPAFGTPSGPTGAWV